MTSETPESEKEEIPSDSEQTNFIQEVDAGNVDSISFDHVDEIIHGAITTQGDIGVVHFILAQNRLDNIGIQLGLRYLKQQKMA